MILNKSYIYRIYLTTKQKNNFSTLYNKNVFLFNRILEEKKERIDSKEDEAIFIKPFVRKFIELRSGNFISYMSTYRLANQIIKKYKDGYLKDFPMAKNALKYPKKIHFDLEFKYTLNSQKLILSIDHIGSFKIKYHRPLPLKSVVRNIIIEERNINEYYINILVGELVSIKNTIPQKAVGLDYSSPNLFVSSDNELGNHFQVNNYNLAKIKKIQRQLSKCKFNSKNYLKLKAKEEKLYQDVTNKRNYFLHKAANYCINRYDLVGVETLSLAKMAQKNNLGKHTYENAYDKFLKILEYKAKETGKYFIKVPRFYPSTRICSNCGQVHEKLSLSKRIFTCDCGFEMDRDLNAAINIREKAIQILLEKMNKYYKGGSETETNKDFLKDENPRA